MISTPEKSQNYIRKIIVHANILQRKYFPDNVNDKYDPGIVYDKITKKIDHLLHRISKLETANNSLKDQLEKQEFKQRAKIRQIRRTM